MPFSYPTSFGGATDVVAAYGWWERVLKDWFWAPVGPHHGLETRRERLGHNGPKRLKMGPNRPKRVRLTRPVSWGPLLKISIFDRFWAHLARLAVGSWWRLAIVSRQLAAVP